jgi:dihydrofolate reductase
MTKVIFGMAMSLDGFVNDRTGSVGKLYPNLAELGQTELLQDFMDSTGAVVMGRHSYDMAKGDFTGYEYQAPIFVITHAIPETVAKGENNKLKFHFVTDGVEKGIEEAKGSANGKLVMLVGGVNIFHQALKAGLIDEIHLTISPILLGAGLRLFEGLEIDETALERISVTDLPQGQTNIALRIPR